MSLAVRLGLAAVPAMAVLAMMVGDPALAYDAGAGKAKAEALCAGCHGKQGRSQQPAVPSLAGQHNDYIVLALYQFRAGHRPSALMAPIAATLTDSDLGNLAAYYSALKPWGAERSAAAAAVAGGPALTQQRNCVQCHGPGLAGQDSVPRIAGQKIDYLKSQLRAFRAGNRGDIDGNMTSAASQLTDGEIDTLADYVSGLATP
ncbi:MAG TPA: c-type cytochrome [Acetobacteraceae bacterium]|nr:c-type cytochrome [Acetobacteraceae bacterium]